MRKNAPEPGTLPASSNTADFHLGIARSIGELATRRSDLEAELAATPHDDMMARGYVEREVDTLYDRHNALTLALSAEKASSLGAAAVQLAAACELFETACANEPDPQTERAIARLLHSCVCVVADAAHPSAEERAGISALFPAYTDSWREVHDRLEGVRAAIAPLSRTAPNPG